MTQIGDPVWKCSHLVRIPIRRLVCSIVSATDEAGASCEYGDYNNSLE
jgi:hypothetical protein